MNKSTLSDKSSGQYYYKFSSDDGGNNSHTKDTTVSKNYFLKTKQIEHKTKGFQTSQVAHLSRSTQ